MAPSLRRAAAAAAVLILLTAGSTAAQTAGPSADLSGVWQDGDWGTVKLAPAGKGVYEGTYSGTYGKDVGRIRVTWSAASKRFEGTWSEGTYRFGRLSLRLADDGKFIRGILLRSQVRIHARHSEPGRPAMGQGRDSRLQGDGSEHEGDSCGHDRSD